MELFSIGEVSKITGISVRTLRYYDDINIITPEKRDNQTGYRYYSQNQLLYIQALTEFKSLGFSLSEIKSILYDKSDNNIQLILELKDKIYHKKRNIQSKINDLNVQLDSIDNALHSLSEGFNLTNLYSSSNSNYIPNNTPYQIYTKPPTWVISIRKSSLLSANDLFLNRAIEIQQIIIKNNLSKNGNLFAILHDGYFSQFKANYGDLELCIPIKRNKKFRHKNLKFLNSQKIASTIHIGHYKNSLNEYRNLISWIENNNYRITGPPIEVYILEPSHAINSNLYVTEICFPIK